MTTLGIAVAIALLLWVSLLYVPFRWRPLGIFLFVPKVYALGYLPFLAALGITLAVTGALVGAWWIAAPAGVAAAAGIAVMVRVGAVDTDLTGALGSDWERRIPARMRTRMVSRWWRGRLPRDPEPRLRRDVVFATVPGTDRALLCDVWEPPTNVPGSGAAVVYLHGSAYYFLDKDLGTRPLFRHLAAQGHVVIDVAHRLFPETDVPGMVADAKRATAWVRSHCAELGIEPDRIVLVGGSSGGHLSLLAAYTHEDPALTPPELRGSDPRVCGVASLYGQVSLEALYKHASQEKVCHPSDPQPDWTAPPSPALVRLFGDNATRLRLAFMTYAGRCDWLLGGTPSEVPERYRLVSMHQHIRPDGPRTLFMHGTHDEMAPVGAVRELARELQHAGVPVTAVYLPHTDHMFDLAGTAWSPAARVAFHTLERFLAVIADTGRPGPSPRDDVHTREHQATPPGDVRR
jgi:acetyl esterase/lipase